VTLQKNSLSSKDNAIYDFFNQLQNELYALLTSAISLKKVKNKGGVGALKGR